MRIVRQSQLISPWGIGQMINFPEGESLMVAGLDAWEETYMEARDGKDEFIIEEDRLKKRLNVDHFRLPPDYRHHGKGVQNPELSIPFVRFPQWHYCYRCGAMEFLSLYEDKLPRCRGRLFEQGRSCHNWPQYRRQLLMPIRFIVICGKGHVEDFPCMEWVHNGNNFTEECKLRYNIRHASSALGAIRITCTCDASRSMVGSFNKDALIRLGIRCSGQRPWLGEDKVEAKGCSEELHTVQRGAANVYFPAVRSSIYLPNLEEITDKKINDAIEKYWHFLKAKKNGQLMRERFEAIAAQKNIDVEDLYRVGLKRDKLFTSFDVQIKSEENFRKAEFGSLYNLVGKSSRDLYITSENLDSYTGIIHKYFNSVLLIHRLRETRALVGFSRLLPEDGTDDMIKKSKLSKNPELNWLPAITVRGEGIFLEFSNDLIKEWEKRTGVVKRAQHLIDNYNKARLGYQLPERVLNPKFILLHTFAHLIINQFSLRCGYGSSSLKERIYCNIENTESNMNGILIYTASGDSEGSMGGLVKQGEPGNLEEIIINALNDAEWCSSDPICIQSQGQGPGSCNLAACHNCALLPETSCEEGNRLLDRALLIGMYDEPDLGYFLMNK